MHLVSTLLSLLDAQDRLRQVRRLLVPIVALPTSIMVWLSVLDPDRFTPVGIIDSTTGWLPPQLDGLTDVVALWAHAAAEWLIQRSELGGYVFVPLSLLLAMGCRPPLHPDQGRGPSPWFVTAAWLSAAAAVTCGFGRWLPGGCLAIGVVLMLVRTVPLFPVRHSAEHMLESLSLAVFAAPMIGLALLTPVLRRYTGRIRGPQIGRSAAYASATSMMLGISHRRMDVPE